MMKIRSIRLMVGRVVVGRVVVGSLVLACAGCAVGPPPVPPPPDAAAQNCRQFTQPITMDGKTMPGYGVACLQTDGTWRIVMPAQPAPPPGATVVPLVPYEGNPGPPGSLNLDVGPHLTFRVGGGDVYGGGWDDLQGPQSRPWLH